MSSDNIGIYEQYLFAADKTEFLESCKNASELKQYIRIAHLLNQPDLKLEQSDRDLLNRWASSPYGDKKNLVVKDRLLAILNEGDATKRKTLLTEFNTRFLRFNFFDERVVSGTQGASDTTTGKSVSVNSALAAEDLKRISTDARLRKIEDCVDGNTGVPLYDLGSTLLKQIKLKNVKNWSVKEQLFNTIDNFAYSNEIVDVLVEYKNYMRTKDLYNLNFEIPEHLLSKLTLEQLNQLGEKDKGTNSDYTFRRIQFQKKYHRDIKEISTPESTSTQRDALKGLLEKVTADKSRDNTALVQSILEALLYNGYEKEEYDSSIFSRYLARPIFRHSQFTEDFWKKTAAAGDWRTFINYNPVNINKPTIEKVFEAYLSKIINTPELVTEYGQYFNNHFLRGLFLTNKVLAGGSIDEYKAHFGEASAKELEDRKNLEIARRNKRQFKAGETVSLTLEVKNVPELTYKIFEIDTETYYKKNLSEIDDNIDLDGLIPEKFFKIGYQQKKSQQHTEEFVFDDITARPAGVFIIEFVGGGVSSRAVIRKGTLNVVTQPHFRGFKLYVVDDQKKICVGSRTGIYIDGKFHKVNEKGFILIPFHDSYQNTNAIITHEGFNSLSNISLETENYSLASSVIFNEESLVSGRKLRLILRNKLLLNQTPITLAKFEEFNAEVQLTNYDGVTNYKHFKDVKLSDSEDLVLELIVPPMLTRLEVRASGKVKDLTNKEVNLEYSESITITRNENTDLFITAHLNRTQEGHVIQLRGKNGETISNRQIVVQFFKNYGNENDTFTLSTDTNGVASLGNVDDLKWIFVRSPNNSFAARTFVLGNLQDQFNIATEYNICENEELLLPSMGKTVEAGNFELLQLDETTWQPLKSILDHVKLDADTNLLVITGLEYGRYTFSYQLNVPIQVSIVVHKAKRWESNPLYLDVKDGIMELRSEAKYLNISKPTVADGKMSFKISSNSLKSARAHVLAYHHHSQLLPVLKDKTAPLDTVQFSNLNSFPKKYNTFRSNRVLADEHVYVNERKNKQTFTGNTLDKPSILLHREKVRETKDDEEVLNLGKGFAADEFRAQSASRNMAYSDKMMKRSMAAPGQGSARPEIPTSFSIVSNLDYFEDSGRTFANLKPDDQGVVHIPADDLSAYSYLVISVADSNSGVVFTVPVGLSAPRKIDLRVKEAKEQGVVYSEDFFALSAGTTGPASVEDRSNTSQYIVEDLASLLDVLLVIAGGGVNKPEVQKFKFLTTWNKLSNEERFKKFEELGGHELNLFAYLRDRAWFDEHIKPALRFKAKKELIDHLLLDDAAEYQDKLRVEEFNRLSVVEQVLIVHKLKEVNPEVCKQYLDSLKKKQEVTLEDGEKKKARYESILASKKIDEPVVQENTSRILDLNERIQIIGARASLDVSQSTNKLRAAPQLEAKKSMMKSRKMDMKEKEESKPSNMAMMDMMDAEALVEEAPVKIEKYQKKGAAFEFKERQDYFKGQLKGVQSNRFWTRVVENILTKNTPLILGDEIIEMNGTSVDVILALAFTDLPFTRGQVDTKINEDTLVITSTENLLIFCKRMQEKRTEPLNMELVISQKFYDPEDRYIYDEKDSRIYTIKEVKEFLTAKIYEARVAFTNVGEGSASVKLITQIPQGAMPVNQLEFFKIHDKDIASMRSEVVTFKFYFPSVGTFKYYPATIMKNGRFVAAAKYAGDLTVVSEYSKENKVLETLQDILNYGTTDDILNFMSQKNIFNDKIFNISKVRWIFKSSHENFQKAIKILKERYFYDPQSWSYSVYHADTAEFLELIKLYLPGLLEDVQYLKVFDMVVDRFEPLEYDPLINPRAHDISEKKHNILNKAFKETYERFLKYCVEKGTLGQREKIILTAYLVLQDRIKEALEKIREIDEATVLKDSTLLVQYEYLRAYLSIYTDSPNYQIAREAAKKYFNFADLSWRKRFREIQKQLTEHDKGLEIKNEEEQKKGVQEKTNIELADKSEFLGVELKENFQLAITHKNVSRLTISFYKLEMEILFSNDPFLEKDIMNFVSVNPNFLMRFRVAKSSEFKTSIITIPAELQKDALFIQVKAKDKFEIVKAFNSHLRVHTIEDYGLLNVSDLTGKCLQSVYVKCFSKKTDGTIKFYKDGYTDFRGSFDYASLNSDSLANVEKYGLFVYSQEHGSVILTAKPPSQVGRIVKDEDPSAPEVEEPMDEEFADAPILG